MRGVGRSVATGVISALLGFSGLVGRGASAAPINYGTFPAVTVVYQNVTEDSSTDATPLFGAPTVVGNALSFNPVSFGAASSNGAAPDLTDGTLAAKIQALPGQYITTFSLTEAGDYTLLGSGTAATTAQVALSLFLRIYAVNGVSLFPGPIGVNVNGVFTPSGGAYYLPGDSGLNKIWTGSVSVDVDALLASHSIPGHATLISIDLDNGLYSASEPGTVSHIKKKDISGVTITVLPEPASLVLLMLAAMPLLRRRRT
jgi:hypothetical protein